MATAWEVDTAVYEEKNKSVTLQDKQPYGVFFSTDGTKMYMLGTAGRKIFQYLLSTPWDLDTAAYDYKFKYVGDIESAPQGFSFSSDGSKMYVIGPSNGKVWQYTLSTPWNIDTAVYVDKFKYVGDVAITPRGVTFGDNGSKMYITGTGADTVYQYTLSTFWDVGTATYADKLKYLGDEDGLPWTVVFKPDGTKMYMVGYSNDTIYQYALSTFWDVNTAAYENKFKYVGDVDNLVRGMFFKPDGAKMYIAGDETDTVFQYDLPVILQQAVSGTLTFVGTTLKGTSSTLSGALTFVGDLVPSIAEDFYQAVSGAITFIGRTTKKVRTNLSGSLSFIGSLRSIYNLTKEVLQAGLTFIGSLTKVIKRLFRQAELSIAVNQSDLSVKSNKSDLSVESNKSELSIESNKSDIYINKRE